MKNHILEKLQNDPAYSQIIQIYSGLFDTQDERESFIIDLAKEDILLAAACKTSSVDKEEKLESYILELATFAYNKEQNEESITNYCLVLMNFDNYEDLYKVVSVFSNFKAVQNKKRIIKSVIYKILVNYKENVFDMIIYILNSSKYNILKYIFESLNYDGVDFEKNKDKILYIANKIPQDSFLPHLFLLEKNTVYPLFNKAFVVEKIKEHFQNNQVFRITILWINKYRLKEIFSDEYLFSKIIESKYWQMAFDFIERMDLIDVRKAVLYIIDKSLDDTSNIDFIIDIATKYQVLGELSPNILIDHCLLEDNHVSFKKLIDIYGIVDLKVIEKGVLHFLEMGKIEACLYIINECCMQSFFSIEYLFKRKEIILFPKRLELFIQVYSIDNISNYAYNIVENYFNSNKLGLAEKILDNFNLLSDFNFDNFIKKAFELKKWGLLSIWYKKYNLDEKYTMREVVQKAVENKDIHNAYQIAQEFNLNFSDFYQLSVGDFAKCVVRKITKSRIFVNIEGESRNVSIYIGELSNKHIPNIYNFEYKGIKISKGQQLIAKVIDIDESGRINLSLKQINKKKSFRKII